MDIDYIFPITIILLLTIMYIISRIKLPIEKGKKVLMQKTCSGRLGATYFSIPLVRLAVYDNFIVFCFAYKKFHLNIGDIECVYYKESLLQRGVVFVHNNSSIDKYILVSIYRHDKFLKQLSRYGVNIK